MIYQSPDYQHGDRRKIGVLLVNLGTPDEPEKVSVKRYLKEFLSDPRVVEFKGPRWLWLLILNGVILNTRPKKSAAAYASIWDELGPGTGSPLMAISQRLTKALQNYFHDNDDFVIELAMRYGQPSVANGLKKLQQQGAEHMVILPLYPQYSATTTASIFDAVTTELQHWRMLPSMRFVNNYYENPLYIDALANQIKIHWQKHGRGFLLMSFHGIPQRYLHNGDPYHCYCQKTGRLVAEKLHLTKDEYRVSFQSIFGREEWLKPYTEATLKGLPKDGIKHVQVICPGFAADCLETLEEIAVENRDYFMTAGGQEYSYIPALNDSPEHIELLADVIKNHSQGWQPPTVSECQLSADIFQNQSANKPE